MFSCCCCTLQVIHTFPLDVWPAHRDTFIKAEPGESPNDRNDRAIRVAAKW
jgi:hypothetical protein